MASVKLILEEDATGEPGRLDPLTKEIIAVAASAVNACHY